MASPCTDNSETVDLIVTGTPGVLEANAHDVSHTFSATQGDLLPHTVTDGGVDHVQTQTVNVPNPLAGSPVTGIVVCAFSPIVVSDWTDSFFSPLWSAELIIDGVEQDRFDLGGSYAFDPPDPPVNGPPFLCVIPTLLGQIDIPAGGSTPVTFRKTISNNGLSQTWTFQTLGDKMVAQLGP